LGKGGERELRVTYKKTAKQICSVGKTLLERTERERVINRRGERYYLQKVAPLGSYVKISKKYGGPRRALERKIIVTIRVTEKEKGTFALQSN